MQVLYIWIMFTIFVSYYCAASPIDSKVYAMRVERSNQNNIIEEENLGTTVSGFKFTWAESKLGNELFYRNINV